MIQTDMLESFERSPMENTFPLNPSDYTLAIKNRGRPSKPWRWEIYVAGKSKPVLQSDFFETMSKATRSGKAALAEFRACTTPAVSTCNKSSKPITESWCGAIGCTDLQRPVVVSVADDDPPGLNGPG